TTGNASRYHILRIKRGKPHRTTNRNQILEMPWRFQPVEGCWYRRSRRCSMDQLNCITVATRHPRLEIEYCTQCRWLLRAAWMAQEVLTTFVDELAEVALVPGKGGVFDVRLDGETIWCRKDERRSAETREIKQKIRDRIDP